MDETKKFFASQIEGVDLLSSLIADNNIECEKVGTGNLDVAHHPGSSEDEYRKIWAKCKVVKRQFYSPERRNKVPADLYE